MASPNGNIKWTILWKITWEEFTLIKTEGISKHFIAVYENVAYHWRAEFSSAIDGRIKFNIILESGPADFNHFSYSVEIQRPNKTYRYLYGSHCINLEAAYFGESDVASFHKLFGLNSSDSLVYRILITIPLASLAFSIKNSNTRIHPFRLFNEYQSINDPGSKLSDLRLISSDGKIFYCNTYVLGIQSKGLAALFRHRQSEEEKQGIFRFPTLDQETLDLILKFLYTGKLDLTNLSVEIIMKVADFAQQYKLEEMQIICTAALWDLAIKNDQYISINDADSNSSDLQLISSDEKIFYCHATILGLQSDGLAALFRHRLSDEEKGGIFRFPTLDQEMLDLVLKFLYTGKLDLTNSSVEIIMDMADFAQQYDLKGMKIICTAALWELAVKKPGDCFNILRFADLHSDGDERMKYLKDRAMNVLVENYEKLQVESMMTGGNKKRKIGEEESQASRLRSEFVLFINRRVEADVMK